MATVRDVARKAGVSPSTASIVLAGKAQQRHISDKTRLKVEQAARELGYRPSVEARFLRGQKGTGPLRLALFWADDRRVVFLTRFLQGAFPTLPEEDMTLEVQPYSPGHLAENPEFLGGGRFHAAIMANAAPGDLAWLEAHPPVFPVVIYNRRVKGFVCVCADDGQIGKTAADALLQKGKHRPGVITARARYAEIARRDDSFAQHMAKAGYAVPPKRWVQEENSISGGERACEKLLPYRPDCLFCCSDAMAYGALRVLHRRGLRVPGDVAVLSVGNGDPDYRGACLVPLTAVPVPIEEMAKQCVKLAGRLLRREKAESVKVTAPLQERDSL